VRDNEPLLQTQLDPQELMGKSEKELGFERQGFGYIDGLISMGRVKMDYWAWAGFV